MYQWPQKLYDGSSATFEMLRRPDTVESIGIVEDKIILLNDEQPNRDAHISFAGGELIPVRISCRRPSVKSTKKPATNSEELAAGKSLAAAY